MSAVAEAAPTTSVTTMVGALNLALRQAMQADPTVLVMGEDVGRLGGVFRVTDGLQARFGEHRVIDTPLAESGIVGTAIGLALRGYRPVCEIQFDGFVFPAVEQIVTQLAKLRYRSRGRLSVPVVVRIPYGGGIGAVEHHSESPEAYFAHTPGLRVMTCATPADAWAGLRRAIASPDPVIFLEPKRRYWDKAVLDPNADPEAHQNPGPGGEADGEGGWGARVVRAGSDLTLVGYGPSVTVCRQAAEMAATEGRSLEVIDLRSLAPLDVDTVAQSVTRTGRLVIVHEAPTTLGIGAELAARIGERCFYHLEAPVLRVGGWTVPYPVSRLEHFYLPDADRVLAAVDRAFAD